MTHIDDKAKYADVEPGAPYFDLSTGRGVYPETVGLNPKDIVGAKKAPLALVPPALIIGAAEAMAIGADKYGPFNWRDQPIQSMTYVEAALRHIYAFIDGQDLAEDTRVHHIHHALAGLGILADAIASGRLVDNRPVSGPAADLLRAQDKSSRRRITEAVSVRYATDEEAAAIDAKVEALLNSPPFQVVTPEKRRDIEANIDLAILNAKGLMALDGTEGGDVLPGDCCPAEGVATGPGEPPCCGNHDPIVGLL